jgi:uncharacterized protein
LAGATLFTLLDDIATLLDDISAMSKVAIHKTAGVLGDDLALNAKQVNGISADRELPVVWKVAKGSAINKAILIPAAVAISAVAPWAIMPLLMLGGAYLCYEGVEKIVHSFLHPKADEIAAHLEAVADPEVDLVQRERDKIQGAIRTDFILSAEIIVITLGTLAGKSFAVTLGVLLAVGVLMTIGVYGLVAAIVKIDDLGLRWIQVKGSSAWNAMFRAAGRGILWFAPHLMRALSIAGTAAMFLVGGGIMTHQWHAVHTLSESIASWMETWPVVGGAMHWISPILFDFIFGVVAGACIVAVVMAIQTIMGRTSGKKSAPRETSH